MDNMEMNVDMFTQGIKMYEEMNRNGRLLDKNELVQAYKMRGLIYAQTGQPSEASDDFGKALELVDDIRENGGNIDENAVAEIYASRAFLYLGSGDFNRAFSDLKTSAGIWEKMKKDGIPFDESMMKGVQEATLSIAAFATDEEAGRHVSNVIGAEQEKKKSDPSYDNSALANKYYFSACGKMNSSKEEAIAGFSKCIETFLEIDEDEISEDDLETLSSAYMCRAEMLCRIGEDEKSLDDFNEAISIEESLGKDVEEMTGYDLMDVMRLYSGRAMVLDHMDRNDAAINDYEAALRLNLKVFEEFSDAQEDYFYFLERLVDCLWTPSGFGRMKSILQEFLSPVVSVDKTKEADKRQRAILEKVKNFID